MHVIHLIVNSILKQHNYTRSPIHQGEKKQEVYVVYWTECFPPFDCSSVDLGNFYGRIWNCMNYTMKTENDKDDDSSDDDDSVERSWSECVQSNDGSEQKLSLPFEKPDIDDYAYDEAVLEEFPLTPLQNGYLAYLKYKSWEQHIQSLPEDKIPEEIPNTWHPDEQEIVDDENEDHGSRHDWAVLPLTLFVPVIISDALICSKITMYITSRKCTYCEKSPIKEYYYACTVCRGMSTHKIYGDHVLTLALEFRFRPVL